MSKSPATLAAEILHDMSRYSPTMRSEGTPEQKKRWEADAKASFDLFADSWIRPRLELIIAKGKRKK
jgi:hypothetical protein